MNDRELLEMAAKAANMDFVWYNWNKVTGDETYPNVMDGGEMRSWNPLTDDGDALRLAAKLRIAIRPGKHYGDGCSAEPTSGESRAVTVFRDSKDMAEQMRYAIVIAAAEIGKAMP